VGIGHPLYIGNQVTVGHRCIVHGCTLEDNCMIGMGAIIMNGPRSVVLEHATSPPPFFFPSWQVPRLGSNRLLKGRYVTGSASRQRTILIIPRCIDRPNRSHWSNSFPFLFMI